MGQDLSSLAALEKDLSSLDGAFSGDEVYQAPPNLKSSKPRPTRVKAIKDGTQEQEIDLDQYDLEGFTREEVIGYNSMGEPGQRLQDALTPKKVAASIQKVPKTITNGHTQPSIAKQMNHYIRKHPFFEKSLATFTKSERRQFERNVYDFARGLGLKKSDARRHVVKARQFCGEEQYDSDSSAFEGEIDNSRSILETLSVSKSNEVAAVSTAIDLPTRQVESSDETRAAPNVSTNSGEDVASMSAGTAPPSKKRKVKAGGMNGDEELRSRIALLRELAAPGQACAQELSNKIAAQQGGDGIDEGKVARRALKRERKRQKQLDTIKDDRIEREDDTGDSNACANSQEPGTKEGGRKREKSRKYPSLKTLMKETARREQRDDQLNAEETFSTKKGRKRRRHRNDEMPADAILSSRDDNTKSSETRNPGNRGTVSDEPSSPQPGQQRIEQRDF